MKPIQWYLIRAGYPGGGVHRFDWEGVTCRVDFDLIAKVRAARLAGSSSPSHSSTHG